MPSYCFGSCTQEQAIAEPIAGDGDMTFYWVRTKLGTIDRWSERDSWPDVEFVRQVDGCADTKRIDWLDQNPVMAYRGFDYDTGEVYNHHVVVDERRPPRTGIVKASIRKAIDTAMQTGKFSQ